MILYLWVKDELIAKLNCVGNLPLQIRGHSTANLDPLGINAVDPEQAQQIVVRGYMNQFSKFFTV